jgi:hypothetical protein
MNAADIERVIRDAFTETGPPDATEIVPRHNFVHLECDEIRDAFRGKRWEELSVPFLTYHRDAVFFFTPRAWSYFLPAYMSAILARYDETDTMVNGLLATVTPTRNGDDEALRRSRIAALSSSQRVAFGMFIEWVAAKHPEDLESEDCQDILVSLG